jgi:hypothetical protein
VLLLEAFSVSLRLPNLKIFGHFFEQMFRYFFEDFSGLLFLNFFRTFWNYCLYIFFGQFFLRFPIGFYLNYNIKVFHFMIITQVSSKQID